MGHLNPQTTLNSYVHMTDVVLAQAFDLAIGRCYRDGIQSTQR